MKNKFDSKSLDVLDMLAQHAPDMKLRTAYNFIEEYSAMRYDNGKFAFIILSLFKALGFDDNGYLRDSEIAKKLENMPIEIWEALSMASYIHANYACGFPGLTDESYKDFAKKYGENNPTKIIEYKRSILEIAMKKDIE